MSRRAARAEESSLDVAIRRAIDPSRAGDQLMHPSVVALWREFLSSGHAPPGLAGAPISAWHFCDQQADADLCADLVREGKKRATAPALWELQARGERIPRVGDHHVVTKWNGVAQCVIRTEAVDVVPFREVPATHAAAEGEGDGSLAAWRASHRAYYSRVLAGSGFEPTDDMPIVCERFVVVHPPLRPGAALHAG
jgi:uncharacterized protein YhfF